MKQISNRSYSLFALFALLVIFSNELFSCFFIITGMDLVSGLKSRQATGIAIITYLMLAGDCIKRRITRRNVGQFAVLGVILLLLLVTGLIYPNGEGKFLYWKYLLAYGALSIPAAYVGMKLARVGCEITVLKLLPFFLAFISVVVGYVVIFRASEFGILGGVEGDAMTYQAASYAMSFSCTCCLFLLFFNQWVTGQIARKIMSCLVIILALVCGIGCIVGGGRGAFVHLVCVSGYILYRVMGKRGSRLKNYFLLGAGAVAMVYLSIRFNIFQSAGGLRITENLTTDYNRDALRALAINSFKDSPFFGHGVGSVWWEVGFYSHNMIQDLLVETGLIGTILVCVTIFNMLRKLMRDSKTKSFDMFILLLLLAVLVQTAFSGYWISSFRLFLVWGYVYGKCRRNNPRHVPYIYMHGNENRYLY